jgi:hypothetical protein
MKTSNRVTTALVLSTLLTGVGTAHAQGRVGVGLPDPEPTWLGPAAAAELRQPLDALLGDRLSARSALDRSAIDTGRIIAWNGPGNYAYPEAVYDPDPNGTSALIYAITGLGLRMASGNVTTMRIQRRLILPDGRLGPREWLNVGSEPNVIPERIVELPDGAVATGASVRADLDNITDLSLKFRVLRDGYLESEQQERWAPGSVGNREADFAVPYPHLMTGVGFRGDSSNVHWYNSSMRAPFYTRIAGRQTGAPAVLKCPFGKEAVGTVQIGSLFNNVSLVGQFGIVCGPIARVNAASLAPEAELTVLYGEFTNPINGQFTPAGSASLPAYRLAQTGEVVRICSRGYTLDDVVVQAGQYVNRVESLQCRNRGAAGQPVTIGVNVGVGAPSADAQVRRLDVPSANHAEGLLVFSGPVTRAVGLHHLPR